MNPIKAQYMMDSKGIDGQLNEMAPPLDTSKAQNLKKKTRNQ